MSYELQRALDLAVALLSVREPGDSRAVSDEFVALAAVASGDVAPEVMAVIEKALAGMETPDWKPPVPQGVYFQNGNFYGIATRTGMGTIFYVAWKDRRSEFPRGENIFGIDKRPGLVDRMTALAEKGHPRAAELCKQALALYDAQDRSSGQFRSCWRDATALWFDCTGELLT